MTATEGRSLLVLVPAAKLVSPEMQALFGPIPPPLVPLGGRLTLERMLDGFSGTSIRVVVGIDEGASALEQFLEFFPDQRIDKVEVSGSRSLGETLLRMADAIEPEDLEGPVIVYLGDTVVDGIGADVFGRDFVAYAHTEETQRWTLFRLGEHGFEEISDKLHQEDPDTWLTFVGVWGFRCGREFMETLRQVGGDPPNFYVALAEYFEAAHQLALIPTPRWFDCGHVDNYCRAKRQVISSRFFNQVAMQPDVGAIVKRSDNAEKLRDEHSWYQKVPRELQYFTPRVFGLSPSGTGVELEIEFYPYPSLDECFVYGQYDLDSWERIFRRIFDVLSVSGKFELEDAEVTVDLEAMYLEKTQRRVSEAVLQGLPFDWDPDKEARIEGVLYPSLTELIENLESSLNASGLLDPRPLRIIHGDLCFGNILYDYSHGIIKLVDPRGRFGKHDIYGDVYYELGKLSHSALGLYDVVKANRARVRRTAPNEVTTDWFVTRKQREIGRIFERHAAKAGYSLELARVVEGLLFLSMLPLHRDQPSHQVVMLTQGIRTLAGALSV
jgi:hypothetical protein